MDLVQLLLRTEYQIALGTIHPAMGGIDVLHEMLSSHGRAITREDEPAPSNSL
jgi:hypothetical protein